MGKFQFHLLIFLIALSLFSCTPSVQHSGNMITRLKNRGPLALSTENPYLASNLLLAREMNRSSELRGFIQTRGAPLAIEVYQSWVAAGPTVFLYYPDRREQYEVEEDEGLWLVRGPLPIERDKMKLVSSITRNLIGEPKLALQPEVLEERKAISSNNKIVEKPVLINPKLQSETFREKVAALPQLTSPVTTKPKLPPAESTDPLINKVHSLIAQGSKEAQLNPKGDIVHHVTFAGETLSMIARWYTLDRANAGRIARVNNLKNPNALKAGDVIIVPSYLVRNKLKITATAVEQLSVPAPAHNHSSATPPSAPRVHETPPPLLHETKIEHEAAIAEEKAEIPQATSILPKIPSIEHRPKPEPGSIGALLDSQH